MKDHGEIVTIFSFARFRRQETNNDGIILLHDSRDTRASSSGRECVDTPRQPLELAEVLAKLAPVLDRPRSAFSLEEEFGADPGVATTVTNTLRFSAAADQEGEGPAAAQVQRILRTRHERPGVTTAAHDTRVREVFSGSLGAGSDT